MPFGSPDRPQLRPALNYAAERAAVKKKTKSTIQYAQARAASSGTSGASQQLYFARLRAEGQKELDWLNTLKAEDPYFIQKDKAKKTAAHRAAEEKKIAKQIAAGEKPANYKDRDGAQFYLTPFGDPRKEFDMSTVSEEWKEWAAKRGEIEQGGGMDSGMGSGLGGVGVGMGTASV